MSRCPFDLIAPFAGQHNPLRFGWSEEQLEVMRQAMGLTGSSALTTAAVACSLIAEKSTTGRPLRYSRSQSHYSFRDAYEGDSLMIYRRVVPTADWLIAHGYAEGRKGLWAFRKQSILSATPKLMALAHLVDIDQRQGAMLKDEIILRDKAGKSIGFCDTDEIRRMRREMRTINARLADQQYFFDGAQLYIPPAARIFNRTLRRGGRLYHQASSYQQMKKADRAKITMLIGDEVSPTVEVDFDSLHMKLAYYRAGKKMPEGDLYEVDGFTRKLAKVATLISLNADGTEVGAITSILKEDAELALDNGLYDLTPHGLRAAVEKLIAAIRRKHYRIKDFFGTGIGAQLMRTDSDIAVKIMLAMVEQTGRCPLVVHDSFLVPARDAALLQDLMVTALADAGHTGPTRAYQSVSSPLPIHLEKHSVDQAEPVLSKPLWEGSKVRSHADHHDPGVDPLQQGLKSPPRTPDLTLITSHAE